MLRTTTAPISRRRTRRTWDFDTDADLSDEELDEIQSLIPDETGFPAKGTNCPPPPLNTPPQFESVQLPGEGRPGPGCGNLIKARCNTCGAVFEVEQGCGLRTCPRCYKKWARREALSAVDVAMRRAEMYPYDRLVHAEISFEGSPEDVFKHRTRAIKIAKKHGVLGFSIVAHHVRGQPGAWRVDGYVHYHILGVVDRREGFKTVPDLVEHDFIEHGGRVTGTYDWTFKVIKQRRGRSWWVAPTPQAMYRIFYYQLEHASVQYRRHALSWAGSWWDREDIEAASIGGPGEPDPLMCPKCGGSDVDILADGPEYVIEKRYRERGRMPWTPPHDAPLMKDPHNDPDRRGGGRFEVEPLIKKEGRQPVPGGECYG